MAAKGVSVPASKLGKYKTFSQQLAVGFALAPFTAVDGREVWLFFLWLSVVLTLVSGAQYLYKARVGSPAGAM